MVKFISYDGKWPNLCSGTLVLAIGNDKYTFPKYCLSSGGGVSFGADWQEEVTDGPWMITDWPEGFPEELKNQAEEVVNDNVSYGCCGGCI